MKQFYLLLGFMAVFGIARSQQLSVDDVLEFSSLSSKKFENYISRRGFIASGKIFQQDTVIDTWQQALKPEQQEKISISRRLAKYQSGKELSFSFQTSSKDEYFSAIDKLKADGFFCGADQINADASVLLQRRNMRVEGNSYLEDSTTYYSLFFQQKPMPSPRSVRFASDLLQFSSHEILATFFGAANVRKDLYYFSDKEFSRCSILYPNTARQAVFVWEDEQNLEKLSHVIIGGSFRTSKATDLDHPITENTWALGNGIRFNMKLSELVELLGEDLSFYGRSSELFLMLLPKKKGGADQGEAGIVLDCINCQGATLLDKKVVKASDAIDQGLRLHVGMLVLMPK